MGERTLDAASAQSLKWILDAIPFYVLIVDANHRIVAANEAVRASLGKNPGELIGEYCPRAVHGMDSAYPGCPLEEAARTGRPVELELFDEKTSTWVASSIYPTEKTTPDGAPVFLHAIRDITEKKNAETERADLERQLIQSQKMEALARLAGGVAHDFNNLLTLILNYASFVGAKLPSHDPAQEDLRRILRAGKRAATLTRQLLAFGRRESGKPRVVELNQLVTEIEKLLRRTIGEDVELDSKRQADLWRVKIDPGQVEQILVNLVLNARDAMPLGGRVSISTGNTVLEPGDGRPGGVGPGRYVRLEVADTGSGMTPEVRERAFDPFFTTKGPGKGTGLGLSMVHGIAQQAGGGISLASAPGQGTRVEVLLPATDELPVEESATRAVTLRGAGRTALVVDDDAGVRAVASDILRKSGFRVLEAEDSGAALAASHRDPGEIDLLLTDVVLEGLSGKELAELLRNVRPRTRVLYMSGYPEESRTVHGRTEPLLEKPFTSQALLEKVAELLEEPFVERSWEI